MTDPLTLYADLYRDYPECVPEGWWTDRYGPHITVNAGKTFGYVMVDGVDGLQCAPPWFLAIALGTLRSWLEGKGWDQKTDRIAGAPIAYRYEYAFGGGPDLVWQRDAHRAAIAAARMVKEQE